MGEFRITENNHTYHGCEFGDKNLPTLVCFHGMTCDLNSFYYLKDFLSKDFHLILLDGPGHGETDPFKKEEDYRFTSVAKRMDKVISQMVKRPFYILGHSWGADLALNYTKIFPDKIKGVVLIDGGYVFPEQADGLTEEKALLDWDEYINSSKYNSWEEIVKTYQEYTTKDWGDSLDILIHSNFKRVSGNYVLKADRFSLLATIKAFYQEPCSTTYDSIKCPVLLFHATVPERDPARSKGILKIQNSIKDITTIGIKNTKHNIHWDTPNEVANEILLWKQQEEI
ncbi:pimeloyl-ACP methyl ester carboxylesterase [Salirhabdus euzebyi]|uniref:Pimeloyl-ACP methyl ester carboxylesterase n=1 Tax=Salirhabdus euzebyi TaxID=394506 RepID=A0A841Q1Y6_9BACI|nr:alpha/beta hydrolase [Salirhabdus euzebyi]MBB6452493.1 pimeloyl-ACP methyl ester carboxylesterase [Salirhabdus euzebyi]